MDRAERCDRCKWWVRESDLGLAPDWGECKRHAPAPRMAYIFRDPDAGVDYSVAWPELHGTDFCGEFTPMDSPVPLVPPGCPLGELLGGRPIVSERGPFDLEVRLDGAGGETTA